MKKFMLLLMFFGLFIFNVNLTSADVAGCQVGDLFSRTTGQSCGVVTNTTSCKSGDLFSSVTGKRCITFDAQEEYSSEVSKFNGLLARNLVLGSRGEYVKSLQQLLKDEGYYFGKVDGKYGKITDRAVKDFKDDNNIFDVVKPNEPMPLCWPNPCEVRTSNPPVISGVSGPQTLKVNQAGTWEVKASSPNGGNLSYTVLWGDEELGPQNLPPVSYPLKSTAQSATFTHSYYYDGTFEVIFTVTSENTIRCITTPCPSNGGSAQTSLTVKVARETSTSKGYLEISPESVSLKMGDSIQVKAVYQPPMPECPTGLGVACIQMMPQSYEVDATWTVSNESIAKMSYLGATCLNCKVRPMVQGVSAGTTELKATYTLSSGEVLTKTASVLVSNESIVIIMPVALGTFSLSKNSFDFSYTQGGALPAVQVMDFTNTSNTSIAYTISVPNKPNWLNSSYNANPMYAAPGQATGLGALGDPTGLSLGSYATNIILTGNFVGSPLSIPVTLTVSRATTI